MTLVYADPVSQVTTGRPVPTWLEDRHMARAALTLLILAAITLAIVPVADAALRVEQQALDVGVVQAGSDAVGTWIFHNDGEKPVRILRAKPS